MSITVNTNMSSIIAQCSLYKATNKMNTALERLSTGLKINSSKDDAAGSAISTKLEYKMSSYDVAKDNAQMGQSMLDTANGTLSQINSMLQRIRDLSEQASNGTYGEDERKAMQAEIDGLTEEIYRIKNTTEFNGKKILGEEERPTITYTAPTMSIADVSDTNWADTENQVIGISSAEELEKLAKLTNAGNDTTNRTFVLTSDIDLSSIDNWTPIGRGNKLFNGDFDGNNFTISNLTIKDYQSSYAGLFGICKNSTLKNLNLDTINITSKRGNVGSLVGTANYNSKIENVTALNVNIHVSTNYTGGLVGFALNSVISNSAILSGTVESSNGDYIGGIIGVLQQNSKITNSYSNCNVKGSYNIGGFIGVILENSTVDNCVSEGVVKGNNQDSDIGGFIGIARERGFQITNCVSYSKIQEDIGIKYNKAGIFLGSYVNNSQNIMSNNKFDITKNSLNLPIIGSGQSVDDKKIVGTTNIKDNIKEKFLTNFNKNVTKTNLQVGINSDSNSTISVDTGFSLGNFNVSVLSEFSARNSLDKIDAMMSKITDKLTNIGATQNRLESVMEFQEIQRNALTSANSLIKDADIAKESANYVKNQILQNVTSTLLSTANQNPSIALQLI